MKIGVFDSGIGGITVLSALREALPDARFIYLGDTANLPYGTKSPTQVVKLSLACAEYLKEQGVDAVVVACNTASSLALEEMRQALDPIPVYGVVEPGVQAALSELERCSTGKSPFPVLILATRATVKSHAYGTALQKRLDARSRPVFEQACPLLVPLIEEGWTDHPVLHQTVAEYVASYRHYPEGVVLLGCTHYPWIQKAVQAALPGWRVVNSAQAVGEILKKELAGRQQKGKPDLKGTVDWIFTDPEALPAFARQFVDSASGVIEAQDGSSALKG